MTMQIENKTYTATLGEDTNRVKVVETEETEIFDQVIDDEMMQFLRESPLPYDFKFGVFDRQYGFNVTEDVTSKIVDLILAEDEEDETKHMTIHNYGEFVDQFYVMNPETDELVRYGRGLQEGMIVLIGDPHLRGPDNPTNESESWMRLVNNRWCQLFDVVVGPQEVSFIAVYAGGTQQIRRHGKNTSWLVKKHSIPSPNAH